MIDTTCDQNLEMEQQYDFDVIPLSITLENQTYLDGEEITVDAVYEAMPLRSGAKDVSNFV